METIYVPQYRKFLKWKDFSESTKFYSLANAINFIKDNAIGKFISVAFEIDR